MTFILSKMKRIHELGMTRSRQPLTKNEATIDISVLSRDPNLVRISWVTARKGQFVDSKMRVPRKLHASCQSTSGTASVSAVAGILRS